ncbi:MAG TPA: hypothetical protein VFW28_08325 [Micropepsaceae bacterium]|nr:hypothetical protein [Micropepsaceae bacterium]
MLTIAILFGIIGVMILAAIRMAGRRRNTSTEHAERAVTAFIASPLIAAMAAFLVSFVVYREFQTGLIFGAFTAYLGYFAAVVLGIPVHLLLRWRNLTSSWINAASGAVIAIATGFVMWGAELTLFAITGALGLIAGLSFWAIARPDRSHGT